MDYLKKCIHSIFELYKNDNIEIIIIDNASTDESKLYLSKIPKKHWLKIIHNLENKGFAGGNNIGIKKASGDYIVLLNNDTVVTENWIEKLIGKYFYYLFG